MYQLLKNTKDQIDSVFNSEIGTIPFDPANTDYQKFKVDVADGAELQDPDGKTLTSKQINALLETLP